MRHFETKFLEEAEEFIAKLGTKAIRKILYNLDLAEQTNDPRLFKKLQQDIWEFRMHYAGKQIRLLAFWDKTTKNQTLVIATHGFIKKVDKVPANEINRAVKLRVTYFNPNFAVAKFLRSSDEKLALKPIFVRVNPDKLRFVGPAGRFCSQLQNLGLSTNKKTDLMATKELKTYSLADMKDKYIGKVGTEERDEYEYTLQMDVLGRMIKTARRERKLTQEELGRLIGVQKAQISKLESSANSATIDTIIKVFSALKAEINFNVRLEGKNVKLA